MKRAGLILIGLGLAGTALLGVTPQRWVVRTMEDVLKGQSRGVSVSSEGEIALAPKEEEREGPAEEFYLSLAAAPDGTLFLGTGHAGRIYRIPAEGKPELYFQAPEMDVTCLALGRDGALYAGTSPNGKVYRVKEKDKGEVFFNPGEKYIWALLAEADGTILAAVGEGGGVYKVSPQGEGQQILKVQENHILCLKRDKSGDLFAGSGGNGLLYRLSPSGRTAVLFESPYEEIRNLDFDGSGNVIVAASGTPVKGKKEREISLASATLPEVEISITGAKAAPETETSSPSPLSVAPPTGKQPSAVFLVSPDGEARKIWSASEEMIYSLIWRESDRSALIGTGPQGRIYSVDEEGGSSLLLQKSSQQVYSFLPVGSRVYALCDNPPRLDVILAEQRLEGEYLSTVLDSKIVAAWGQVSWQPELPPGTSLQLQSRSGNSSEPGPTWSDWSPPYGKAAGESILSPKARFLQFRALLKTGSGRVSPGLRNIVIFYLQSNVAPTVKSIGALAPGVVLIEPLETEDLIWGAAKSLQPQPAGEPEANKSLAKELATTKKTERRGLRTIYWEAEDENDDRLRYELRIGKEGEAEWRVLEEEWPEAIYAFDTVSLPDGVYRFQVIASDAPSNPAALALTGEKVGPPLTLDNTPPAFKNVVVTRNQNKLRVSFLAEDALSPIVEAKAFVRPGEWQDIFPQDGICDSRQESFDLTLTLPAKADNLVTLRVKDEQGNVAVVRQSF
jgi:hypothetical protein